MTDIISRQTPGVADILYYTYCDKEKLLVRWLDGSFVILHFDIVPRTEQNVETTK